MNLKTRLHMSGYRNVSGYMYPDTFLYLDTNVDPLRLHLKGYKRVSSDFYVSICIHLYPLKINIHKYRLWHRLHHSLPGHKMETDDDDSLCCIISRGSVGCAKKTTSAAVVLGSGLVAEATTTWDACRTFELTPK